MPITCGNGWPFARSLKRLLRKSIEKLKSAFVIPLLRTSWRSAAKPLRDRSETW